ncbi:MAG TPA: PepSY domain-containing protein [Bacillota bacterium]|nr:PepSY domain-containing protein [Bacillota bacterium]
MKKKIGLIVGIAFSVCVLGLGIYHSSATGAPSEMTKAEIKDMINDQYPGEIASIEKQRDEMAYEIKLENETKGYTLKVDAKTGEILKIDESTIAKADELDSDENKEQTKEKADSEKKDKENSSASKKKTDEKKEQNDENDTNNSKDISETSKGSTTDESEENTNNDTDKKSDSSSNENTNKESGSKSEKKSDKKAVIDIKKAVDIALKEYSGTIVEIELDTENGQLAYEVEIVSGNQKAGIDINAYTGEIILIGTEGSDGLEGNVDSMISIQKAIDIARKEFSGTVVEIELDHDDGRYIYEVEITSGNDSKEIEIDGESGQIIDID